MIDTDTEEACKLPTIEESLLQQLEVVKAWSRASVSSHISTSFVDLPEELGRMCLFTLVLTCDKQLTSQVEATIFDRVEEVCQIIKPGPLPEIN